MVLASDHAPLARRLNQALGAQDDIGGHPRITHAQEREVRVFRHLPGSLAENAVVLARERARFLRRMGPESHLVSGAHEVAGHRVAHQPQTQETEFCHRPEF